MTLGTLPGRWLGWGVCAARWVSRWWWEGSVMAGAPLIWPIWPGWWAVRGLGARRDGVQRRVSPLRSSQAAAPEAFIIPNGWRLEDGSGGGAVRE